MKKLLLSCAIILGTISVNAQEAGNMWLGGTIGGEYTRPGGTGLYSSAFNFSPEIGFILSENLGVGLELGMGYSKRKNYYDNGNWGYHKIRTTEKSISFSPFLRYTFLKGSLGALFVDGGLYYQHAREKNSLVAYYSYETKKIVNYYGARIRPGVAINLSENFSLIGKFGFIGYTHENGDGYIINSYKLSVDMKDIALGAVFTF